MLHDFDRGGLGSFYPVLVPGFAVLPVVLDTEDQEQDRELKRDRNEQTHHRDQWLSTYAVNGLHRLVVTALGEHTEKGDEARKNLPYVCTESKQDAASAK